MKSPLPIEIIVGITVGLLASVFEVGAQRSNAEGTRNVAGMPSALSPTALAATPDGDLVYVACATADRILEFDTREGAVKRTFPTPAAPSGLALSRNGRRLYATCGEASSYVCVIDTLSGRTVQTIVAGHSAMSPVLSRDERVLYFCNRFEDQVTAIDLQKDCEELWKTKVVREPVAAALTPNGLELLVANHLHSGRSDGGVIGAKVSVIHAATGRVIKNVQLPRGSSLARGIAVSPDGRFAAVTHLMARYYLPTSDIEFGKINANALSILDLERHQWIRVVYLDWSGKGAANPWSVAWTPNGGSIVVTHAGTHEISIIEAPKTAQKPVRVQRRIALPGNGPRAMTLAGSTVFVAGYFSDDLFRVDLTERDPEVARFELAPANAPSLARQGEALFNDARLCYQGWQSCASCHDSDARVDALNWDLLNDGEGNPKNAKSLVWSHCTAPAMALGIRASAEVAVRAGIKYILFTEQPESVACAIDEYLKTLQPAPSPHLAGGSLSAPAERGKALFQRSDTACARCHPGPAFTDLRKHDVGTLGYKDQPGDRFDTPTLLELWRTAPYLHDGSAADLHELLTTRNAGDHHGRTSRLSDGEIDDLVAYLLSL